MGKTTLISHFLKSVVNSEEQFLGHKLLLEGKILFLTEENKALVHQRVKKMGIASERLLFLPRARVLDWKEALSQIQHAVGSENVKLVVIDTLQTFWDVRDENEATAMARALLPLQIMAQNQNISIVLIHHLRKANGSEGTAHRGSGALVAAVDIALELTSDPRNQSRRKLEAISRFDETPRCLSLELQDDHYVSLGSPDAVEKEAVKEQILEVMPGSNGEPVNKDELVRELDPKPSGSLVKEILSDLTDEGIIERHGKGVRGSPYLYRKNDLAT
jgi:predicted ATP-dependent serine protease